MTSMKFFAVVAVVAASLAAAAPVTLGNAGQQVTRGGAGALEALVHKTGWIPLGDLTRDSRKWATGSNPTATSNSGTFEILGKTIDEVKAVLPKVGDRIQITARVPIIILDYATAGEDHRLEPPMMKRGLERRDNTGLWLEVGAVVEVRVVKISPAHGEIKAAWARVSPPTK